MRSYRDIILERSIPDPATGCWLWTRAVHHTGYGTFTENRGKVLAHRASYKAFVGPIPAGLEIDHLCRVRHCVNPKHLEPVTKKENGRRGMGFCGVNFRKTHCNKGHEFTTENTYTGRTRGFSRTCRACNREGVKRYTMRKRARLVCEASPS